MQRIHTRGSLTFQIEFQPLKAPRIPLAGGDERFPLRKREHLRRLSARGGRHVEDVLSRLRMQENGRKHGGQTLQIYLAAPIERKLFYGMLPNAVFDNERILIPFRRTHLDPARGKRLSDLRSPSP